MKKNLIFLLLFFLNTSESFGDDNYEKKDPVCPKIDKNYSKINSGIFISGSSDEEKTKALEVLSSVIPNLREREPNIHEKELPEFEISKKLVTQSEFRLFVRWTGYRSPSITLNEWEIQKRTFDFQPPPSLTFDLIEDYIWDGTRYPEGLSNHPVVLVSRKDAEEYAKWLSTQDGCVYRLPTAEEWEKAARGKDGRTYPWGNKWDSSYLNAEKHKKSTSEVGEYGKDKSPYGMLDAMGNVMEWTSKTTETDDKNMINRAITKGCSWQSIRETCRAAFFREWNENTKHMLIGFRLVREVPQKEETQKPESEN